MSTLTVNPDADPETATTNGRCQRIGVDEAMATIRAGAGNSTSGQGTVKLTGGATANQFSQMARSFFLFDITSLPVGAVISAVKLGLYNAAGDPTDAMSGASSDNSKMVVCEATPASNTGLANGDFGQVGTTDFGRSVKQASIVTDAYEVITLNAAGISYVESKYAGDKIVKLAVRYGWDFDNTIVGLTIANGAIQALYPYTSNDSATFKPYLEITYSVGGFISTVIIS